MNARKGVLISLFLIFALFVLPVTADTLYMGTPTYYNVTQYNVMGTYNPSAWAYWLRTVSSSYNGLYIAINYTADKKPLTAMGFDSIIARTEPNNLTFIVNGTLRDYRSCYGSRVYDISCQVTKGAWTGTSTYYYISGWCNITNPDMAWIQPRTGVVSLMACLDPDFPYEVMISENGIFTAGAMDWYFNGKKLTGNIRVWTEISVSNTVILTNSSMRNYNLSIIRQMQNLNYTSCYRVFNKNDELLLEACGATNANHSLYDGLGLGVKLYKQFSGEANYTLLYDGTGGTGAPPGKSNLTYHVYDEFQGSYLLGYNISLNNTVTNITTNFTNVNMTPFVWECNVTDKFLTTISRPGYITEPPMQPPVDCGSEIYVFMRRENATQPNMGRLVVQTKAQGIDNKWYPLSGANILVRNSTWQKAILTGDTGYAAFDLYPGAYVVEASKTGYLSYSYPVTIVVNETTRLTINMSPPAPTPPPKTPTPYPTPTITLPPSGGGGAGTGIYQLLLTQWSNTLGLSLTQTKMVFGVILILIFAIIAGSVTASGIGFAGGAAAGFIIASVLGWFPIWAFFAMILIVTYAIMRIRGGNE